MLRRFDLQAVDPSRKAPDPLLATSIAVLIEVSDISVSMD
jgi:hypothetical protein